MENIINEFKIILTSTTLGFDHPATLFLQQVQDGFGSTLESGRYFLERMVTHKRSYASSSYAHFPPQTKASRRRKTFVDELDRANT